MFYRFITYLKFIFTATNQHGVHSPFVYAYVTECLYKKAAYTIAKSEQVALKSMAYFNAKTMYIPSKNKNLAKWVEKEFPQAKQDTPPFDLIYFDNLSQDAICDIISSDQIHNDSILLVSAIHENGMHTKFWESLKNKTRVSVTIDMFYCGAVFFRKEQVKEHFKIRI